MSTLKIFNRDKIMNAGIEFEGYKIDTESKKENYLLNMLNTFSRIAKMRSKLDKISCIKDTQLVLKTKTNNLLIHVDARFQPAISEAANAYLKKFCFRFDSCAESYVGSEEYSIVRNRVENLVAEGLANKTIDSPEDVKKVIDHNLMFQSNEDYAIIDACKSGSKLAQKYVFVFFSAKVIGMMHTSDLLHNENTQDLFFNLQTAIFTAIEKFNPKRSGFGMSKKYTNQVLFDEWRCVLAKEICPIVCDRHQIADMNKLKHALTSDDLRRMSVKDIAAKCKVSKNVAQLYVYTCGMTSLDNVLPSDDGEAGVTVSECVASKTDDFAVVEDQDCIKSMLDDLEKEGVSVDLWKNVMLRTLSAFKESKMHTLSDRVSGRIAKELQVPRSTVQMILEKFKGLSQDTAAAVIYQFSELCATA